MSEGSRWGPEGPPEEAYSRVTNAERFRPLHTAMLDIIGRLERGFDVEREEGYGLDEELERRFDLALPGVRLTPNDPGAAPIAVVFSGFPGIQVRFGRWYTDPFPSCGCDACDESAEGEIERLTDMIDDVVAGRFREGIRVPSARRAAVARVKMGFLGGIGFLLSRPIFTRPADMDAWREAEFWAPEEHQSSRNSTYHRNRKPISRDHSPVDLDWKPWPRREANG